MEEKFAKNHNVFVISKKNWEDIPFPIHRKSVLQDRGIGEIRNLMAKQHNALV